ncbi:MAG: hypothetical protein KKC75_00785, partial [Nanoarchaeota archaeon]|nr:hypothetical protein [Nanoarchaeota archaeon]MBU1946362.1 hypothetical protein [Nanoarchaeota archaeon]
MNNFDAYFFDLNNLFKPSFSMPTSIEYNIKDSGFLLSQSNPLGLKILNEPQHQTINFQISDNDINLIDMAQYQHVNINGLSSVNNPGFPNLPFQSYEISIPDNAEFLNISIVQGDYMEISLSKDIIPSPQEDISKYLDLPRNVIDAIQDKYGRPGELRKNEIIYNSSDYFPNRLFSASSGYNKDHEKIISISFYPVQYNPIEKKLIVIKNAQIKVMYGSARETPSNLKTSEINIQSSNGYLWYSDVGNDNIYKIDASGNIQSNFNGPSVPNGLAFDGTYLWISSLVMGYIYKYNTNGDQISYFWPGITTHDLAWANGYLWVIGNNDRIYKMDTNGNTITSFYPPSSDCRGITFDGTYLWLSDLDDKTTYKVDTSGNLISTFNNPGNYPWGLAWSGSSLWLVDLINSVDVFVELTTSGTLLSQINSPTGNPVGLTWQAGSSPHCSGTDTSCGVYPNCNNCNSYDGCSGNSYLNYYCSGTSCSYSSDSCTDCSCSCGGYNTAETTANGNCGDGKDNDCDGYTDSADSGCSSCSGTDTSCG